MFNILLPVLTIGVAVVIAILAVVLPPEKVNFLLMISRFFEVMIPILAVGALIKYLVSCWDVKNYNNNVRDYK